MFQTSSSPNPHPPPILARCPNFPENKNTKTNLRCEPVRLSKLPSASELHGSTDAPLQGRLPLLPPICVVPTGVRAHVRPPLHSLAQPTDPCWTPTDSGWTSEKLSLEFWVWGREGQSSASPVAAASALFPTKTEEAEDLQGPREE